MGIKLSAVPKAVKIAISARIWVLILFLGLEFRVFSSVWLFIIFPPPVLPGSGSQGRQQILSSQPVISSSPRTNKLVEVENISFMIGVYRVGHLDRGLTCRTSTFEDTEPNFISKPKSE